MEEGAPALPGRVKMGGPIKTGDDAIIKAGDPNKDPATVIGGAGLRNPDVSTLRSSAEVKVPHCGRAAMSIRTPGRRAASDNFFLGPAFAGTGTDISKGDL